ncbi:hypothetical protein MMC29_006985 [Sticta canariensis]|nr:hypothetical protein [Sticta canariensis]
MVVVGATSFFGQILLGRGYQLEMASKVAAVNYLQVLFATFFGITILGDKLSWLSATGSLMIAAGVVLANASKSQPASKDGGDKLPTTKAFAMPADEDKEFDEHGHLLMQQFSAGQHLKHASPHGAGDDSSIGQQAERQHADSHTNAGDVVVELQAVPESVER